METNVQQLLEEDRCTEVHNPGVWPYVARCVLAYEHRDDHTDRAGNRWKKEEQNGREEAGYKAKRHA